MAANILITGVNGHLGNNLLRNLLQKGEQVRGTVRNLHHTAPFEGLDFTPVYADLHDKASLLKALQGIDTLYQVAAVYELWTKNPKKDVYQANMTATRNIMEAAAIMGVKKVIYVSSVAAMGRQTFPISPETYNTETRSVYYRSKIDSEKLAWKIAKAHQIHMVSVCPSAMIGEVATRLTPSQNTLQMVLNKAIKIDARFYINWVDVKDVSEGCYLAAQKGRNGERYGLGTATAVGITEIATIAQNLFPERGIKTPATAPKWGLYLYAWLQATTAKITRKRPKLLIHQISMYYNVHQDMDISKSVRELGYHPTPPKTAIEQALRYLYHQTIQ
ncbi:NAD-dependent epimerase/dehydratase family protein [Chitinophaga nivalis]|uniref:NAD-dependent epimerase/dehydratase family protein n=1 Tax=Chitinophaga nivalis TaxID=2991709 RepID=A0ABT3IT43_9BACT|nr:NAD-dependent epimerase/dehydratase family protein [Chitinophaga nivalis]MCW3463162.1 NAD-dependent epimerase/dehydratase family protein [Chitinophaga nivalis]MCW3487148.1 NAD-dependent epimerase/dehydratase family protein [Chitinophaga nivalis]